jgi:hypothetical protein
MNALKAELRNQGKVLGIALCGSTLETALIWSLNPKASLGMVGICFGIQTCVLWLCGFAGMMFNRK